MKLIPKNVGTSRLFRPIMIGFLCALGSVLICQSSAMAVSIVVADEDFNNDGPGDAMGGGDGFNTNLLGPPAGDAGIPSRPSA